MRKILSLMMAAFFSVGMFAAGTATTVYYTAGADVIGTYTVKLNVHMGCNDGDDWKQYDMSKTDKTYGSDPIYKAEFTDYWNGLCTIQFQLYDGSTWKSQDEVFNGSWHGVDGYNGKMYVHSSKEWVEADSQPGDCTIGSQPFLGCDGGASAYANTFKVCAPTGVNVVNVQTPGGKEPSIYVNFPAAPITACSLGEGNYDVQGAGLFLHCAAFVQELTDVTVTANNVEYAIKVYRKPNYYLTGTAAFGSWNLSKALPFFGDSIVVDLAVGEHQFKVLPQNDKWDGAMGYAAVNAECSSDGVGSSNDGNVKVTLEEAGKLKIKVADGKLCVIGKFKTETPQPTVNYYLVGSFNDWKLETAEAMVGDSIVREFEAGSVEFKVLPQKTNWDNAKGFAAVNAECSSDGLSGNNGDNVIFTLKEKGNVKIKVVEGKLCITGPFYVPEPQPEINYYLVGTMNNWSVENAIPLVGDSLVANVEAGKYECKIIPKNLAQDWSNALGFAAVNAECSSEGITEGENSNIVVELKEKADIKIKVVEGKLCITGPFAVPAAPTLVNGFYLIGQKGWAVADLSAELLFTANPDKENEYQLNVTLKEDEGIKVVKVENDVIKTWYPDGEGNEYKVDKNHAGAKTIYFQELYNEAWKDFGGHIYIEANPADGISNMTNGMNAQKFIENGQLFIRVNGTIYSVVGQAK